MIALIVAAMNLKTMNKLLNMFKLWCGPGVRKDLSITLR